MGDSTGISWCDRTYNIWIGCTKVSDGCQFCYAERDNKLRQWTDKWGPGGTRHKTKTSKDLSKWNKEYWVRCESCGWRGKMTTYPECPACGEPALKPTRQRVFVNSLSDLFEDHPTVFPWRNEFWAMSQMYNNLDYLLLTKRPENYGRFAPRDWNRFGWPSNIWLGVSVENQARANERLPFLSNVGAQVVKWVSVEPMLGPVSLHEAGAIHIGPPGSSSSWRKIDWVVCGGESGAGCRKMNIVDARSLLQECDAVGVKFYMKQLGGHPDRRERMEEFPKDLRVREYPTPFAPPRPSPNGRAQFGEGDL